MERLIQFQCGWEGSIFYYQTPLLHLSFRVRCPICGSQKVEETGRVFAPVDERGPIPNLSTEESSRRLG